MAKPFKPCSIDGCNGNASPYASGAGRGWCSAHYKRWRRHGDPLGGRASPGELSEWLYAHAAFDGKECLVWPFSRHSNGYGHLKVGGRESLAHRVMCELAHGEPPTPKHEAAHSCGNGHLGCVNPTHLRWDTRIGNQADRLEHGTHTRGERHGLAKLTEADVRNIQSLKGKMMQKDIAQKFGVSTSAINLILTGKSWGWLK